MDKLRRSHARKKQEFIELALYTDKAVSISEIMQMPAMYRQFIHPTLKKIHEEAVSSMNKINR